MTLFSAELMKIRTTKTWRWFGIAVLLVTAWALLRNGAGHHYDLQPPLDRLDPTRRAQAVATAAHAHTEAGRNAIAADMMTSGQFLGALVTMLLGVLVVTGEFHHRTAATTFMANPRRGRVIAAKLAATACFATLFWLVGTTINALVTSVYLRAQGIGVPLTGPVVIRAVLLNLLAFLLWSALGLGLGAAVRSQVGGVVTALIIYLVGAGAVGIAVTLLHNLYPHDWVLGVPVIAPAVASLILVTPGQAFDHAPPPWAGLLVMIAYAVLLTGIGAARIRRLDIT